MIPHFTDRKPQHLTVLHRLGTLLALTLSLAACWVQAAPERIVLQYGAHPANPVLLQEIFVNGMPLSGMERFIASGWQDPKGGSLYDLSLPKHETDPQRMDILTNWIDLRSNQGYSVQVSITFDDLTDNTIISPSVSLIVLMGPGAYFEVATEAPPDETGHYNGRIVQTSCAEKAGGLAQDHWIWQEPRLKRALARLDPAPDTGCPE